MATERIREAVTGSVSKEYLEEKAGQGWRLVALEWEREGAGAVKPSAAPVQAILRQVVSFGLKVSADCEHLEEDPVEKAAMELMLQLIVEDKSLSQVAKELNQNNFSNRRGDAWTQTMVFNLLPRLIEAAPDIRIPEALIA